MTTLSSIAAAGPDLIGGELHAALTARVQDMQSLLSQVAAASSELQAAASGPSTNLNTDGETASGKIAARQLEVFDSLIESMGQGAASPGNDTPDASPSTPSGDETDGA